MRLPYWYARLTRLVDPSVKLFRDNTLRQKTTRLDRLNPSLNRRYAGTNGNHRTVEEVRSRAHRGPFTWKAAALFTVTGIGLIYYFRSEKERMQRLKIAQHTKGEGKPKVGGPFSLIDHDGQVFTSDMLKGKHTLVYFGFAHCPDICPDELDKLSVILDKLPESQVPLQAIMISVDPVRDTPSVLKSYLKEFHPRILGLTGSHEDIKNVCRAYRVYFSTPPTVKPGMDYLVDHSIYFYLMDPEGDFVEAIGRNLTPEQATKLVESHISDWKKLHREKST